MFLKLGGLKVILVLNTIVQHSLSVEYWGRFETIPHYRRTDTLLTPLISSVMVVMVVPPNVKGGLFAVVASSYTLAVALSADQLIVNLLSPCFLHVLIAQITLNQMLKALCTHRALPFLQILTAKPTTISKLTKAICTTAFNIRCEVGSEVEILMPYFLTYNSRLTQVASSILRGAVHTHVLSSPFFTLSKVIMTSTAHNHIERVGISNMLRATT
jgi:hypothetical protein